MLNTEDKLLLQTTDPKNFIETRESLSLLQYILLNWIDVDSVFIRTSLCQSDPYTKCVLLKENRYNPLFTSQGDVIALIDEVVSIQTSVRVVREKGDMLIWSSSS